MTSYEEIDKNIKKGVSVLQKIHSGLRIEEVSSHIQLANTQALFAIAYGLKGINEGLESIWKRMEK